MAIRIRRKRYKGKVYLYYEQVKTYRKPGSKSPVQLFVRHIGKVKARDEYDHQSVKDRFPGYDVAFDSFFKNRARNKDERVAKGLEDAAERISKVKKSLEEGSDDMGQV